MPWYRHDGKSQAANSAVPPLTPPQSTLEMTTCDHGVVAKVKRNIMERDLYPRRWGLGPTALEKKKLKADGKLDKFGRTNEATPAKWKDGYKDYSADAEAPPAALPAAEAAPAPEAAPAAAAPADADEDSKKRKKEDETPEEKAERKRRKAEKKAAKEAKKAAKGKKDDSDSE